MRAILLKARHMPDQLLHQMRRTEATLGILRIDVPRTVMFLCHGNVCRSPFAASYFARTAALSVMAAIRTTSAGFVGPERQPPREALEAARRYDIELSNHRSALVTVQDVHESDLIIVMSAAQARAIRSRMPDHSSKVFILGDLDPLRIEKRTILDPWNGDAARFDESYTRIARCTDALVQVAVRTHAF